MNRRTRMTIICFAVLFLLGFEAGGFQISLLKIVEAVGLSAGVSGVLVSAQYGAIIIMPLLIGGIADRKGKRKVLAVFSLIFGIGCIAMANVRPFAALLFSAFAIGTGYSVCESMISALLAELYQEESGKYLNISQCFFSLGAMISPQLLEFGSEHLGWSYQSLFLICGAAGLLVGLATIPEARGEVGKTAEAQENSVKIGKEILLLAAGLFVYSSLEGGVSYYMDGFVSRELMQPSHAANMLSLFWLFMILGRLVSGMLYRYRRQLLNICLLGTGLSLGVLILMPSLAMGYLCFSLVGFFLASVWPNLMGLAVESYEGNSAQAAGILSTGGGMGAVLSPLMLGVLMDGAGLRVGFAVLGVLAVLGMCLCMAYYKKRPAK